MIAPEPAGMLTDHRTVKADHNPVGVGTDLDRAPRRHRGGASRGLDRWTKKHGESTFGYKNHVNIDRRHKGASRYGG